MAWRCSFAALCVDSSDSLNGSAACTISSWLTVVSLERFTSRSLMLKMRTADSVGSVLKWYKGARDVETSHWFGECGAPDCLFGLCPQIPKDDVHWQQSVATRSNAEVSFHTASFAIRGLGLVYPVSETAVLYHDDVCTNCQVTSLWYGKSLPRMTSSMFGLTIKFASELSVATLIGSAAIPSMDMLVSLSARSVCVDERRSLRFTYWSG